jgi:gamma-glutamyl hydrolase
MGTINQFSIDAGTSRTMYSTFSDLNMTMNLHHCGVTPDNFRRFPSLASKYRMLATNVDRANAIFISAMEHREYPIYATQFHPERNAFEWDVQEVLDHDLQAIAATQYLSGRLAVALRQSQQTFEDPNVAESLLIYQYDAVYTGSDPTQSYPDRQKFYFNRSHTDRIEAIVKAARQNL